ncbi:MAG: aa3-type cytochrome c oxidase subunit IV [Alphaproteobacteria bacterium]|jgi:hypothetical protein|nr:aa3-type cytochrome c oxidase subunit IV [Alphaproteobacteria bacterium]
MSEHKHGTMNIDAQEKTFDGFVRYTKYAVIVIVGIILFMAVFAV